MKGCKHRSGIDRLIIFAITVCYILEICGKICGEELTSDDLKAASSSGDSDLDKRGSPGGMWFGPRLGKRSQGQNSPMDYFALQNLLQSIIPTIQADAKNDGSYIPAGEFIQNGAKRRFTPRLGRDSSEQEIMGPSKNVDFIPRLGREQPSPFLKDLLASDDWLSIYGRAATDNRRPTYSDSKIPPFAPRLGRQQLWPYSKEFYGLYGNPRYARSTDAVKVQEAKSTKL